MYECPNCAGNLKYDISSRQLLCRHCDALSTNETAATFCSFCGSSTILPSRLSKEKKPSKIIPFTVTKEDCIFAYQKEATKMPFLPKDLLSRKCIDSFRGIYMPYWLCF